MSNLSEVRHKAEEIITGPIVKILVKTGITPNSITIAGFLGCVLAGIVVAIEGLQPAGFLAAGIIVLLSASLDMFDGSLARAKGQTTKYGALLDSSLDRLGEAAILLGLLVLYLFKGYYWMSVVIYLTIIGSIMVSYTRARAEGLGLQCETGIFTRTERIIVLVLGLILSYWIEWIIIAAICVIGALAWVTVLQRFKHVQQSAEPVAELEEDSELQAEPISDAEPVVEPEPVAEPEPEPVPEVEAEPEPESEPEKEADSDKEEDKEPEADAEKEQDEEPKPVPEEEEKDIEVEEKEEGNE